MKLASPPTVRVPFTQFSLKLFILSFSVVDGDTSGEIGISRALCVAVLKAFFVISCILVYLVKYLNADIGLVWIPKRNELVQGNGAEIHIKQACS